MLQGVRGVCGGARVRELGGQENGNRAQQPQSLRAQEKLENWKRQLQMLSDVMGVQQQLKVLLQRCRKTNSTSKASSQQQALEISRTD